MVKVCVLASIALLGCVAGSASAESGRMFCLDRKSNSAYIVDVESKGAEMSFKGLSALFPDVISIGTLSAGIVTIQSPQKLSENILFGGGRIVVSIDAWGREESYPELDELTSLSLSSDLSRMECQSSFLTVLDSGDTPETISICEKPILFVQDDVADFRPAVPKILGWNDFNPTVGYAVVGFEIPAFNEEGLYLDTRNLSYRLLINDEPYSVPVSSASEVEKVMESVFDLSGDGCWIPFNYWNHDILIEGGKRYIFFNAEGSNRLSVQSRYVDPMTGEEWLSEIADNGLGGIREVSVVGSGGVEEVSYDFFGRRLTANSPGMRIRVVRHENGSMSVLKSGVVK